MGVQDRIRIRDLRLRTIVGLRDWERTTPQDVVVHLSLHLDLEPACKSDDVRDTVDYREVVDRVTRHVEGGRFGLVERLAGSIAGLLLECYPALEAVQVGVDKPGALQGIASAGVEVLRRRSG